MLAASAIGEASLAATSVAVAGAGGSLAESFGEMTVLADSALAAAIVALALLEAVASEASSAASGAAADDAVLELVTIVALCAADGEWFVESTGAAEWSAVGREDAHWVDVPVSAATWNKQ